MNETAVLWKPLENSSIKSTGEMFFLVHLLGSHWHKCMQAIAQEATESHDILYSGN